MNLRQQAEADLEHVLEDDENGFGWQIQITDPNGRVASLVGISGDVSATVDPATGVVIPGSVAHVALRISLLRAAGFTNLPSGPVDPKARPWLVRFADLAGKQRQFAVSHGLPDHTLGLLTLSLTTVIEEY